MIASRAYFQHVLQGWRELRPRSDDRKRSSSGAPFTHIIFGIPGTAKGATKTKSREASNASLRQGQSPPSFIFSSQVWQWLQRGLQPFPPLSKRRAELWQRVAGLRSRRRRTPSCLVRRQAWTAASHIHCQTLVQASRQHGSPPLLHLFLKTKTKVLIVFAKKNLHSFRCPKTSLKLGIGSP